jgi:hypothetical protein
MSTLEAEILLITESIDRAKEKLERDERRLRELVLRHI